MWWGLGSRDLTMGDEGIYFKTAYLWFEHLAVNIVWFPLYTAFLGTLLHVSTDAHVVTVLHRVLVVVALDVLILALMRRLLPHGIAWLVAAWWAILPINFDTSYTIHLFALVPVLAAWLMLCRPRPWARGGALGIMLVATLLVRNEYVIATGLLAAICVWWERRVAGRLEPGPRPRPASYVASYGIPLLAGALVVLFFYGRSVYQFPELWAASKPKHLLNMCQTYAFGYGQRHRQWKRNPWIECAELMEREFGAPMPSLAQMIQKNPRAVLAHFRWNIRLAPTGLQVLLFDTSPIRRDPGYGDARPPRRWLAWTLSAFLAATLLAGLAFIWLERRYWWRRWLRSRALGWLGMLSMLPVVAVVLVVERPRPAYLFAAGLFLMALTGMCVFAIARRLRMASRLSRWVPVAMVGLVLFLPGRFYTHQGPRPLLTLYERLAPYHALFGRDDTVYLVRNFVMEVHDYVGRDYSTDAFRNRDYGILDRVPAGMPLGEFLDRQGINVFYIDEELWARLSADPRYSRFLEAPEEAGWKVLVSHRSPGGTWMLLARR